jgi:hypothetical protein
VVRILDFGLQILDCSSEVVEDSQSKIQNRKSKIVARPAQFTAIRLRGEPGSAARPNVAKRNVAPLVTDNPIFRQLRR